MLSFQMSADSLGISGSKQFSSGLFEAIVITAKKCPYSKFS